MGPITIFDKSALEMLSIDESCWLDALLSSNITPLYYAECLADLEKVPKTGLSARTPEDIVSEIASKTPSSSSYPNIYHRTLIINDLFGHKVEMSNRPVLAAGQPKRTTEGKIGVHFEQFPESEAFNRWQKKEFSETETIVAKYWRGNLQT
jgi:hypothetical protein